METRKNIETEEDALRQEVITETALTPEQRGKWLAFYRMAMQRKRETQAEMREYAKTPEYEESIRKLREENAKRGTPYL